MQPAETFIKKSAKKFAVSEWLEIYLPLLEKVKVMKPVNVNTNLLNSLEHDHQLKLSCYQLLMSRIIFRFTSMVKTN